MELSLFLFSGSLFFSAFLLFSIQPMVGKFLLPVFGGTPAVWNVCMVFFQAMLLGGYFYAYVLIRAVRVSRQMVIHFTLLGISLFLGSQPFQELLAGYIPDPNRPVFAILSLLIQGIGVSFFLLSSTATLLQSWYGSSNSPRARDPYFLYSASNLGSLFALLGYPLWVEPFFSLTQQNSAWKWGYSSLVMLLGGCAVWRRSNGQRNEDLSSEGLQGERPRGLQRLRWIVYAFVPSSLLLGVTTFLTTDIISMPLLWVVPLSIYLISFVFVFSSWGHLKLLGLRPILERAVALFSILCIVGIILESNQPGWLFVPLHLGLFAGVCFLFHGRLSGDRPNVRWLGEFYLWISLGGFLGGLFNSLLAPLIFSQVAEYPLVMVIACFLSADLTFKFRPRDLLAPAGVGLILLATSKGVQNLGFLPGRLSNLLALGLPLVLCYRLVKNPRIYALGLLALYGVGSSLLSFRGHTLLHRERTFYGTLKVVQDSEHQFNMLFHGSTLHGQQALDATKANIPLAYFSNSGPVGRVFETLHRFYPEGSEVAVVGLGTGALATYARASESWTFFELDPRIIEVGRDPKYFTFLQKSQAAGTTRFVPGDARLSLKEVRDGSLALLVIDAFGSDSVPAHLLTREALGLYWKKLKPDALIAFNISNRYLDYATVLGSLAHDSGAQSWKRVGRIASEQESDQTGVAESVWVVMAQDPKVAEFLALDKRWQPLKFERARLWTDDYYDLLGLLHFF